MLMFVVFIMLLLWVCFYCKCWFWVWFGFIVLGLVLLVLLLLYWLLQIVVGCDVLLVQVKVWLLVGVLLIWSRVEGLVVGLLVLYDLVFCYDDIYFIVECVYLDLDIWLLLGCKFQLDVLQIKNVMLNLVKSDELFELLLWLGLLLQIEMLLVMQVDMIIIDGFCIIQVQQLLIDIVKVCGGIEIVNGEFCVI